jgi:hypothetical protein
MPRDQFIDNLRAASRSLSTPNVSSGQGTDIDAKLSAMINSADLWLMPGTVKGFDINDFADLPQRKREQLAEHVAAFGSIASRIPNNKPATKLQSDQARKHLEEAIRIVGDHLKKEWLKALENLMKEATNAAKEKDWRVIPDEKEVRESVLGKYVAPRLRIVTKDKEVVLSPVVYFGSGRRGVVDLVLMPTYETKYLVTFKNGEWQIVTPHGSAYTRPFTATTLVNTITHLSPA